MKGWPEMNNYRIDMINNNLPFAEGYDEKYDSSSIDEVFAAANGGDPSAMYELGSRYRLGVDGVEKDPVKAIEMYRKVLQKQNNIGAFYHVGYLILDGAYGEEARIEALPYLYNSYKLGDPVAAVQLGIQHEFGEIIPQDLDKALDYYYFALNNGNDSANYNIAEIFMRRNDTDEAKKYYEKALNVDVWKEDAEQRLDFIRKFESEAAECVRKARNLLDSGNYGEAFRVITDANNNYPGNKAIRYELINIDDIYLHSAYLSDNLNEKHENFCLMLLDYINNLKNQSYGDPAFLAKAQSDVNFFLGSIYLSNEKFEKALDYFMKTDVDHTPMAAYSRFLCHTHDMDIYIDQFRNDAYEFERAINSTNWPNDAQKALAYFALSNLYAAGAPGLPKDVERGYGYAQQSARLNSEIGGNEMAKYKKSMFGKITYES